MDYPLATVDELIARTNTYESGELRTTLYAALTSATVQLKGILKLGSLDQATGVVEEFQIERDQAVRLQTNRFLPFRLNNGFVDQTTNPVLVRYGISPAELDAAADLDAQFIRVDEEGGYVKFDNYGFQDSFISVYRRHIPSFYYNYLFRITYDHGLTVKSSADGKYYSNPPGWLKECALLKAREIYQLTNPAKDVKPDAQSGNLAYLVDTNVRHQPLYCSPLV